MLELVSSARWVLIAVNAVLCAVCVLLSARRVQSVSSSSSSSSSRALLLVTAHPDDEAMFFGPLLRSVGASSRVVHVLCQADCGAHRRKELAASLRYLQHTQHTQTALLEPLKTLQDSMTIEWPAHVVADNIEHALNALGSADTAVTIVTFDDFGVSHHPNHIACSRGAQLWLAQQRHAKQQQRRDVVLLQLQSVSLLRKYLGLVEALLSVVFSPGDVFFLSWNGLESWWHMAAAYPSQFVWYRKLFVLFSRYSYLNTFGVTKLGQQEGITNK